MTIGITGGSGSGKTTLSRHLAEAFRAHNPAVLAMDNFYLPLHLQQKDGNGQVNFDLPSAIDLDRYKAALRALQLGNAVRVEEYHFNQKGKQKTFLDIGPSELIITEGLYLMSEQEISLQCDFMVYVDLPLALQKERRIARDRMQRSFEENEFDYQWEQHVLPSFKKYLAPYKNIADFRFNNQKFDSELERLMSVLKPYIE